MSSKRIFILGIALSNLVGGSISQGRVGRFVLEGFEAVEVANN
jgi:hypothetical protein